MRCELIANMAEMLGIVTLVIFFLVLTALPIYSAVELEYLGSALMAVLLGRRPKDALLSITILGFSFVLLCLSLTFSVRTGLCGSRASRALFILSACVGFSVLLANGVLVAAVPSDRCDIIELMLLAATVNQTIEGPIAEWKKENNCTRDPSLCVVYVHNFIQAHCKRVFIVNVSFESVAVCCLVIGIGCTLYGQVREREDGGEEEEGNDREESREMTDEERARLHAIEVAQGWA